MIEAPRIVLGDCLAVLKTLEADSVDACVCDPPYGLEFMGKAWDKLGGDAGTSKPGIGDRDTEWPSFGSDGFGGANPTCKTCGGRARGAKRCSCSSPDWRVKGKKTERSRPGPAMQDWHYRWACEVFRVLKPGAHLLAFSGTRTYHRMVCAIEDAGFEIRDQLGWLYAVGFPKSLDVSKAIDRAHGAEREIVGHKHGVRGADGTGHESAMPGKATGVRQVGIKIPVTAPATDDAQTWDGWGTALKPAWEPIAMARKPLIGTVAANVLTHGTGAINVDGCRVGSTGGYTIHTRSDGDDRGQWAGNTSTGERTDHGGRWPANVMHDGSQEVLEAFAGFGATPARGNKTAKRHQSESSWFTGATDEKGNPGDAGNPARFFFTAKASKDDRNDGLHEYGHTDPARMVDRKAGSAGMESPRAGAGRTSGAKNHHPTVKPVKLMRYLCRLICPPGGLVLDPFAGSGSTLIAAYREGFRGLGIEVDPTYFHMAEHRIDRATAQLRLNF